MLRKFRTMRAPRAGEDLLATDSIRLTRLGRFLRSTSLDELLTLWNILRGDMSLVGPRPLLPEYLPLYTAHQMRRHEVKPGITGWAQVNGRNAMQPTGNQLSAPPSPFAPDWASLWGMLMDSLASSTSSQPPLSGMKDERISVDE